ncbi:MAG: hypothetical protein USCAAHI_00191 [Beijerinckiaceae bacterium]|nr:MAG: hypothetical protein USCAAHI_00191 [Beijerinckiaceae bacterium]
MRRWKDIVELHVAEAQMSLCRRIATTCLEARMSEGDDTVDLDVFNRLAENLRRMIESIGLYRVPRPVEAIHTLLGIAATIDSSWPPASPAVNAGGSDGDSARVFRSAQIGRLDCSNRPLA